jgi:hypothetical protein
MSFFLKQLSGVIPGALKAREGDPPTCPARWIPFPALQAAGDDTTEWASEK